MRTGYSGVAPINPTAIGQIVISLDGVSFTAELPIIGDGWLHNNSGLLLVVG